MIKRYVNGLINHPLRVILIIAAVTLFFAYQLQHLFMILDPKRILPQDHPFVQLNNKIEQTFGGSRVVVIGVVVKNGDVFNPVTLAKIKRITEEVKGVSGILEENVVSISDRKIKYINASAAGMDIRPMMSEVPATKEGLEELKKDLYSNDLYVKSLVSEDGKAAAIITDFRSGVFSPSKNQSSGTGGQTSGGNPWWNPETGKTTSTGSSTTANPWWNPDKKAQSSKSGAQSRKEGTTYDTLVGLVKGLIFGNSSWTATGENPYWTSDSTIYKKLHAIIDKEKDGNTEIYLGGLPIALSFLEADTNIMNGVVFPIAFVVIMGVLFLSFRSLQGMVIPILTAFLSVIWALGLVGLLGIPLDPFTKTLTPLLIVAIAAGHSIQILKRYYEEYASLQTESKASERGGLHPALPVGGATRAHIIDNHKEAVRESTMKMAPVMLTAGFVASASFASLITFHLKTFQAFGLLTAFGILSAVVLELSFIPAFRTLVPPRRQPPPSPLPSSTKLASPSLLDRLLLFLGVFIPHQPFKILGAGLLILAVSSIGASQIKVNNSLKSQFFEKTELRVSDQAINQAFGGTSTFYILVDGKQPDRLKDPKVMAGIEGLQKLLESIPGVGKTQSYVDYLKKMSRSIHGGDPAWEKIPESRQAAGEYLFLYSISGNPADFNRLVNYDYQQAVIWAFLKADSTDLAEKIIKEVNAYVPSHFDPDMTVGVAGSSPVTVALNETMVEGKVKNIIQVSGLTFIIATFVFRSLFGGLLVLLPLLLAVLINFGVMGFSGLTLGIGTATISAMSVGMGADYAIYFIFRLKEEFQKSGQIESAISKTMSTAGKSILYVALAISAGCATLIFPGYYLHTEGILVPLAMLTSSIGAITLIPALVAWLRPKFVFGVGSKG